MENTIVESEKPEHVRDILTQLLRCGALQIIESVGFRKQKVSFSLRPCTDVDRTSVSAPTIATNVTRTHLIRYHDVFARKSNQRERIIPKTTPRDAWEPHSLTAPLNGIQRLSVLRSSGGITFQRR